jgi:uridine kinase
MTRWGPTLKTRRVVEAISSKRDQTSSSRSLLVAISGIDGSGKGYITRKIVSQVSRARLSVASINIDDWLHLPDKRFRSQHPAEHFYEHGIRFQEMFERLVLPLKQRRSLKIEAELADATNTTEYKRHVYLFEDVDVIVLEGIFLLKRAFRGYYDLAVWVDCSFETALERALKRGQEGLSAEATIGDYERIYFAAQRLHFAKDNPRAAADLVINNDPRIVEKDL